MTEPRDEDTMKLHEDDDLRDIANRITAETDLLERLKSQLGDPALAP